MARPRRKMFLADFVVRGMEMDTCFGSAPFPLLHVRELREFATLMALDRSNWPRCLLWHGWLPGRSGADERDPWATSLGVWKCLILPVFRRMVVGKTSLRLVGLRLLVLELMYPLLSLPLRVRFGVWWRSMVMLAWSVAELLCLFLELCRLSNVPNSGVPSLL